MAELAGFMEPATFAKWSRYDGRIGLAEVKYALDGAIPQSRLRLLPKLREHADALTTSFDMIDETHRLAGGQLVDWISSSYQPGKPLDLIAVCTANSRRSFLGAAMGNVAAAYYGMPEIRFHCGGAATPAAFNIRTVRASKKSASRLSRPAWKLRGASRRRRIRSIVSAGDQGVKQAAQRWKRWSFPSAMMIPQILRMALPP